MLDYFAENKSDIMSEIESLKVLDGSLREQILNAVDEFSASYNK